MVRNIPRVVLSATVLLSVFPIAGFAQDNGQRKLALEEVVVTAQKKEESLQDTPIALDAFSAEDLEREGIANVGDLANNVPALTIEPFPINSTQLRIYIRGIGLIDAQVTQDPPVGVYIDGAYIARSSGLATDVTDLQRIEVLRGPQGTLYGRNSTGGAVNMITKRPNPTALEFKQDISTGHRGLTSFKTSLNLPLTDTSAVKLAYISKNYNGFIENNGAPNEYGDYGDKATEGYRFDFGWDVNDWIRIDYGYDFAEVEHTNYGYTVITPSTDLDTGNAQGDAFQNQIREGARQFFTYPGYDKRPSQINTAVPLLGADTEIKGHAITFAFSVSDALEIKYIYAQRDLFDGPSIDLGAGSSGTGYRLDNNAVFSFAYDTQVGATVPRTTQYPSTRPELTQEQSSHELQFLGSVWEGRLDYITGIYLFEESAVEDNGTPHHQLTAPLGNSANSVQVLTRQTPTVDNEAAAIFSQLTWRPDVLDDRLSLTLGARHSEDGRKATLNRELVTFVVSPGLTPGTEFGTLIQRAVINGDGDRDFKDDSFSFTVEFDITEDVNFYAKRSEAYKSGGFNIREQVTAEGEARFNAGFDEEKAVSYEIGTKSELWDRRIRINSDIFHTEFTDQQLNFSIPGSLTDTVVANAGSSTLKGFEMDMTVLAAEGLILVVNYAYLDAEIEPALDPLDGQVKDQFMFNSAPEHAVTAAIDWTLYYGNWGRLAFNATYSYTDQRNGGGVKKFRENDKQPAFDIVNARLGMYDIPVMSNGLLTVAAWVKNLENSEYVVNAIHNLPQADRAVLWGEPRTYGLDFIFRWED